ncbi:MAG: AAA family ATPase [Fuerstiella sp.]|nr:AAA family ATPase [Fuerstiella sp.]
MSTSIGAQQPPDAGLDTLFNRVKQLLGEPGPGMTSGPTGQSISERFMETDESRRPDSARPAAGVFTPKQPDSIRASGLSESMIERLILKYLFNVGQRTVRGIAGQIKLPFKILEPLLRQMRSDKHIDLIGTTATGDSEYALTADGRERGKRYMEECTYFESAPVTLKSYVESVTAQTIEGQVVTAGDLQQAFGGLMINTGMLDKLGPAINSGRGMFLFGEPGNGKTSIAERVADAFGSTVWVPRALEVDGNIMRIFDLSVHEEVTEETQSGLLDSLEIDRRWVKIRRPTVIAGGELTMEELEVTKNTQSNICESPLQMKSNCGTLVIDDFGRQKMPVDVLLNRWIVPLEKRYDFLNLPSGKKIQVPFDQLIIFSTNLEPKDLVDGAFLRRIPYKIEVPDPSEEEFRRLMGVMCQAMEIEACDEAFEYLIATHYRAAGRPYRLCQPRDLLLQVRNYCNFHQQPIKLTHAAFDFAVETYFSIM